MTLLIGSIALATKLQTVVGVARAQLLLRAWDATAVMGGPCGRSNLGLNVPPLTVWPLSVPSSFMSHCCWSSCFLRCFVLNLFQNHSPLLVFALCVFPVTELLA